jgi:hypothetical protein
MAYLWGNNWNAGGKTQEPSGGTMSLPWFRLYRELKDDPKIGALSDAEFRCYIESLCWACERGEGGNTGLKPDNADWAFRRPVTVTVTSLCQKRLLHINEDGFICVPSWDKRQRSSDDSAKRVAKFREKHAVTVTSPLQKRECNALEETRTEETRTEETRTEKNTFRDEFQKFWSEYPRKVGKPKAEQSFAKARRGFSLEQIMEGLRCHIGCPDWIKDNGQWIPHPTTWLNQERFNDTPISANPQTKKITFAP